MGTTCITHGKMSAFQNNSLIIALNKEASTTVKENTVTVTGHNPTAQLKEKSLPTTTNGRKQWSML